MAHIDCVCPPTADGQTRHPAGDTVTLRETLSFRDAVAMRNEVGLLWANEPEPSVADILATLTEAYIVYGVIAWTLVDEENVAIPVTRAAIRSRFLTHFAAAMTVGEEADELYGAAVVLPLLLRASNSSPPTPTEGSTSAPTDSPPTPRKPSSRSSTTTSPMAATATTTPSLVGVSN